MPAPAAPAAAAPAPAATPAPKPEIKVPTERPESDWLDSETTELYELSGETPPAKPKKEPEHEEELEETPPAQRREEKPPKKEPQQPKPEDTRPPKGEEKDLPLPQLRKAYNTLKDEVEKTHKPTIQRLEARVKELETAKPDDTTAFQQKLEAAEKTNQQLEARIRFMDYRESKEFQDNYQKPYVAAWNRALTDLQEIEIEQKDGTPRAATQKDLETILALPVGQQRKAAAELFGDAGADIMDHVREIRRLAVAQDQALENERAKAEEQSKTRKTEQETAAKLRAKTWTDTNTDLQKRYARWFAPAEGDTEGNDLLSRGFAFADLLFQPGEIPEAEFKMLPKWVQDDLLANKGQLSRQGAVRMHALIRNRAANHDRMALQLKKVKAENAQLKKDLEAYEGSEPPGGAGSRRVESGSSPGDIEEANAEIDRLANER